MINQAELQALMPLAISWAEGLSEYVQQSGFPLDKAAISIAEKVGVKNIDKVRFLEIACIPPPQTPRLARVANSIRLLGPNTQGLTLGHSIIIVSRALSNRLLAHELKHVAQYEAYGSIASFLEDYLQQILKYGYQDAPLEIDARAFEGEFVSL